MSDSNEQPYRRRKHKKKPRRINGKRVVRNKQQPQQMPKHRVDCGDALVAVVEGYGVTPADLASARAMVLGVALASTGGM